MKVYKFCPPSEKAFENLKNSQLWFSSPNDFDDKFDSNLPIEKIDLKSLVKKYEKELDEVSSEVWQKMIPPRGIKTALPEGLELNLENLLSNYKQNCVGITCFSKSNESEKMWELFSQNYRGFCLCFETDYDELFFKDIREIEYSETLPIVNYKNDNLVKQIEINYLTKHSQYSFEQELRLIKHDIGLLKFNKKSLTDIFIGKNMNAKNIQKLKKIIKEIYP